MRPLGVALLLRYRRIVLLGCYGVNIPYKICKPYREVGVVSKILYAKSVMWFSNDSLGKIPVFMHQALARCIGIL